MKLRFSTLYFHFDIHILKQDIFYKDIFLTMLDILYSLSFLIYLCTILGKGTRLQKREVLYLFVF